MNATFDQWLKVLGLVGAMASFIWGVYQWRVKSDHELTQARYEAARLVASRKIEATKPFLERQLKLYTDASQIAAVLATTRDGAERAKATKRFWELYWGELALVENEAVETAMVALGDALQRNSPPPELQQLSLRLARACRISLDRSWGIHAWTSPDEAAR
ncbi:MAG: hypothetical protein HYR51_09275 [Candidatus Rokubacteria bacterium]|nr:hypothetical protein [Candidatus Rokubacteria bacterium]